MKQKLGKKAKNPFNFLRKKYNEKYEATINIISK